MLDPQSLEISTFDHLAHGAGGMMVGFNSQMVSVKHIPTGITVRVESERSQHANKEKAIEYLEMLVNASNAGFVAALPPHPRDPKVMNLVAMIKEVREKAQCGLKEAKDAVDLTGSVEGAMIHLTGSTGYCSEGGNCCCGGDLPQIREGCYNWQR